MAARAEGAGYPLSHSQFGAYAAGRVKAIPDEPTRRAIAAALGVSFEEVTAAARESLGLDVSDAVQSQYVQAFVRNIEGRPDEEIRRALAVVEVLMGMAPGEEAGEVPGPDEDRPGTDGP